MNFTLFSLANIKSFAILIALQIENFTLSQESKHEVCTRISGGNAMCTKKHRRNDIYLSPLSFSML